MFHVVEQIADENRIRGKYVLTGEAFSVGAVYFPTDNGIRCDAMVMIDFVLGIPKLFHVGVKIVHLWC